MKAVGLVAMLVPGVFRQVSSGSAAVGGESCVSFTAERHGGDERRRLMDAKDMAAMPIHAPLHFKAP